MLKQLMAQALNGFSLKDLPFFILQIVTSAILVWLIRVFWRKIPLTESENAFLNYLMPIQLVLTVFAIFSNQSPWVAIVFGLISLIPFLGNTDFSNHSRAFYILCIFIAFGCGAANLMVTVLTILLFVLPLLYLNSIKK